MTTTDPKADLLRYLQDARDALLWKLAGLAEYDLRRPLTPTGTNLLGLVKHVSGVEFGYLGDTFGRPSGESRPWFQDAAELNTDMWATAEESPADIVALYRRAWAHSDATVAALALDATGTVPWWPSDDNQVTLHHALVRVIADTHRHAGQADILREQLDGATGMSEHNTSMTTTDPAWWADYRSRLQQAAEQSSRPAGG